MSVFRLYYWTSLSPAKIRIVGDWWESMEHWWIDTDRRENAVRENSPSQCHFIHHKSYVEWWEPWLHVEYPATNRLTIVRPRRKWYTPEVLVGKLLERIWAIDQLNAQILVLLVYYIPLHVSSTVVFIIRRSNCIIQHLVSSHCRWPSGAQVERSAHRTATNSVTIPDAV